MKRHRWIWAADLLLVFLFTAVLIQPLWKSKYVDNWGSIESTFIADARLLRDHWPRPLWQPFWYTGTRFDYVYPPALRYGTAALAKYYPMDPAKAYHLYTGFFYCFGIAGVYFFARVGFQRRWVAFAAAFGAAVVSPSYLFIKNVAEDGFRFGSARLNALVRYGEGPHMTAFAWIPVVLGLTWLALRHRSYGWAVAAGVSAAMIVSNNFYGATALAMFFPFLLWAHGVTTRDWKGLRFAIPIPLIAYGLCAFWLTPSYVTITLQNMQFVSEKGNLWSGWIALGLLLGFLSLSNRKMGGKPEAAWGTFVYGALFFFALNTLGNYYFNFRVIGEPARLVPELDLLFIFGGLGLALWAWELDSARWKMVARGLVLAAAVGVVGVHWHYLRHHRAIFPLPTDYKPSVYFRIPEWIQAHYPNGRSYVTGAVRFWYNAWHDGYQLGGSSEQGLLNPIVMPSQWEIVLGDQAEIGIAWLKILGVDLVVVNGPKSEDWYKDFMYPKKFEGKLKEVFDDGKDNHIYELPRRYRSMARVVDRTALEQLPKIRDQGDLEYLEKYVAVYEGGPEAPTATRWQGTDELIYEGAATGANQSIIVQNSYDPNWRAESNLGPLLVGKDALGFMRIDAPPGVKNIRFTFAKPLEKSVGEGILVVTVLAIGWILYKQRRAIA
jgi:hypothetical protein